MQRFTKQLLATVAAFLLAVPAFVPCLAAGIWNGSTTTLTDTQSAAAPEYPILVAAIVNPANITGDFTVISIDDNGGGSADALALVLRGATGGDPVRAEAVDGGSAATASAASGFQENRWQWVIGYFKSTSSRKALRSLGGETITWGAENTTSVTVGNLTHVRVGGGWGGTMNGGIYHAAVWYGVDDTKVDTAIKQLACGLKPYSQRSIIRSSLVYYQPLVTAANENNAKHMDVFVGDAMTAANLTFGWPAASNSIAMANSKFLTNFDPPPFRELPDRLDFRWPIMSPTVGPLPDFRVVKFVDGFLQLAGASDANAIGATKPPEDQWEPPYKHGTVYLTGHQPVAKFTDLYMRVEIAAANSIDAGDEVFQAADGKAASSGTLRIGVAYESGTGGDIIKVMPR